MSKYKYDLESECLIALEDRVFELLEKVRRSRSNATEYLMWNELYLNAKRALRQLEDEMNEKGER